MNMKTIGLSEISNLVKPSLTRKLFNMAKEYDDVVDFTLGDPDIPTPLGIKQAGCDAIMNNKTRYSQNAGLLELRETISKYVREREGLNYSISEIIVTVGAMEGLYLSLLTLLNKGDEVVIPAPYYVNYEQMVMMCGGTPIIVEYNSDHHHLECPIKSIKESISSKTKAIILNTPCNPSGMILSDEYIRKIADIAINNNLVVITDEVYKCLVYDGIPRPRSISSLPQMKDRTIYVNSMSKEFCMTGWRLGYVLAFPEMIAAMTKLQENVVACAPLPSQYAAIEALRIDKDYTSGMREVFAKRRNLMMSMLNQQNILRYVKPQATFYMMIDISKTGMKSEEFAYRLLENVHVAVVPGKAYGEMCDDYVRLAFTMEEDTIAKGIRRIIEFVHSL